MNIESQSNAELSNDMTYSAPTQFQASKNSKSSKGHALPIANRHFLELIGMHVHQARVFKTLCIILAIISLVSIIFAINASTKLQVVPFVILKDDLGNLTPLGVAHGSTNNIVADEKVVVSQIANYINNLRQVVQSNEVMDMHIRQLWATTAPQERDDIEKILLEHVKGDSLVNIKLTQIIRLPGVKNAWKVNWVEEITQNGGALDTTNWEATLVIDFIQPAYNDTNAIILNPTGMQVKELHLSKLMSSLSSS